MEEFITYLKQVSAISEESCNSFVSKCKKFNFPKGTYLLKSGQVCQYLYYIKSGIGKVYYLKEDGKEIIDWISDEGNLFTVVSSFFTQTPSLHYVKLLEDSELIGITYSDLEKLFHQYHDMETLGEKVSNHRLSIAAKPDQFNAIRNRKTTV